MVFGQERAVSYNFYLEIDMNDLGLWDDDNYKYIINKNKEELIDFSSYPDKESNFIQYKYVGDKILGKVERIPNDTLKLEFTNAQFDSIYLLTSRIFQIDSLIEKLDSPYIPYEYDGEYVKVTLGFENISTVLNSTIYFDEEKQIQNRFKKLKDYLESIKNTL